MLLALALLVAPAAACELVLEQRLEAPFHGYGAVAVGLSDRVLVIGGVREEGTSGDAWSLDLAGSWTMIEADLAWRRYGRGGVLGDRVLLADGQGGGRRPETFPVTTVESLALGSPPRRQVIGQAPTERYLGGAAVYQGRLWLGGGHDLTGAFMDRVDLLDPETGQWSVGPALGEARDSQFVVVAGRLLALGGAGRSGLSTRVERLSRDASTWERRAPMPVAGTAYAVAAVGEQLYLLGSEQDPGRVLRYDSHDDRWFTVQADYQPRYHAAAASVGQRVVVVGGTTGPGTWLDTAEVFRVDCPE